MPRVARADPTSTAAAPPTDLLNLPTGWIGGAQSSAIRKFSLRLKASRIGVKIQTHAPFGDDPLWWHDVENFLKVEIYRRKALKHRAG